VAICCRVLQVSRSGYYAWLRRKPSVRQRRRAQLAERIARIHREHRGVYGSPRVWHALKAEGESVSENTVAKIMREQGLRAKRTRRFVPRTTDSRHDNPVAPNVLDRQFSAAAPNRKWVTDITYVRTDEGWLYLAAVLDLFSRKIVGWSMTDHLGWELAGEALRMGLVHRRPSAKLLHHSDRGVQYTCDDYRKLLAEADVTVSMAVGQAPMRLCGRTRRPPSKRADRGNQRGVSRGQQRGAGPQALGPGPSRLRCRRRVGLAPCKGGYLRFLFPAFFVAFFVAFLAGFFFAMDLAPCLGGAWPPSPTWLPFVPAPTPARDERPSSAGLPRPRLPIRECDRRPPPG